MQTLQLSAVEPGSSTSKLTVVQELPEVGKVVIQDNSKPVGTDSISEILEGMKQDPDGNVNVNAEGMAEYTTAIPVDMFSLASDPKKIVNTNNVSSPIKKVSTPVQKSSPNKSNSGGNGSFPKIQSTNINKAIGT